MAISKKRDAINEIFKELYEKSPQKKVLEFNNETVKEVTGKKFRNQFDATKFETSEKRPELLKKHGFFIIHLGKGNHAFVKGEGYHKFEQIKDVIKWKAPMSVIDAISDSEAQSISTAFNDKIIHDFLFGDTNKEILVHTARRSRVSYRVKINGETLETDKLQIELDGIFETKDTIATVEAKNQDHGEFEIRQLFSVMKYFEIKKCLIPKKIRHLFLIRIKKRGESYFKIYEYEFMDTENPNSIKLVKCKKYDLSQFTSHSL
ncbi:MAG: hypothetical protein ABH824_05695 [Nanoarchaeota archaeon]